MKWYQLKEQAAGTKRLILTWQIYNIFGKNAVKLITFFVTLFAFSGAKEIRKNSAKYLKIVGLSPSFINRFKHFLSYAYSLIDKMEAFTNRFDAKKIFFVDENSKKQLTDDITAGNGVFFICSHLGNIEVLRSFLTTDDKLAQTNVNIFMSENQCKIFNSFIESIAIETNITTFPVEQIGMNTSIELQEKLNNGEIVFMAGDRVPIKGSAVFKETFLSHETEFPKGAFKFAKILQVQIYFIAAVKEKEKYALYLEKAPQNEQEMRKKYVRFLEELTLKYPFQFYHFYDFFN